MGAGAINWADVTAHAAELSGVPMPAQADILAYVNTQINVAKFGGETSIKVRHIRINRAAHMGLMWMRENDDETEDGEVASETISGGSMTVAYMSPSARAMSADSLDETSYGRKYKSLTVGARVPIIPGC